MGFGVKVNTTDILFSKLVRLKDGYICVRCGRKHEEGANTMDCSHYFQRGLKSTRWDFDNCVSLCRFPCHQGKDSSKPSNFGWEYQKQAKGHNGVKEDGEYTAYMKSRLGEKGFDALFVRAHTPAKVDEKSLRMAFKLELKRIQDEKKKGILGSR